MMITPQSQDNTLGMCNHE